MLLSLNGRNFKNVESTMLCERFQHLLLHWLSFQDYGYIIHKNIRIGLPFDLDFHLTKKYRHIATLFHAMRFGCASHDYFDRAEWNNDHNRKIIEFFADFVAILGIMATHMRHMICLKWQRNRKKACKRKLFYDNI